MSCHPNPFNHLTLDDIDAWAKAPAADTGKKIHDQGGVSDLSLTEDGDLLAWVEGSQRHAVMVFFEDNILSSVCSCSDTSACEHAVAVTYEYLLQASEGTELPLASEEDDRLSLLTDLSDEESEVDTYLNALSRGQLLDLILDLADEIPEVDEELGIRAEKAIFG